MSSSAYFPEVTVLADVSVLCPAEAGIRIRKFRKDTFEPFLYFNVELLMMLSAENSLGTG